MRCKGCYNRQSVCNHQDNEKSGAAVKLMNKIKDFQRRNKLTVLLMAHTPKIVQGEPIIWTNLAGSSNLFNLVDSVMAINTTTTDDSVRYIKQLKSRYNEIQYHKDNVVAIKFSTRPDGLKGFEFLNYESEDELIKPQDKATKADEDREIINLIKHFGYGATQIAVELKPKFAPDIALSTYYQRIKKRIQRLKANGLIEEDNVSPESPITNVSPESPITNVIPETPVNDVSPETPITNVISLLDYDGDDTDLQELKADLLRIQASPVKIIDDYPDIMPY